VKVVFGLPVQPIDATHATEPLAAGINPRFVSDRLGHSTVAFTPDVYGHVIPDLEEDALEKIGAGIGI
jgi:integrase